MYKKLSLRSRIFLTMILLVIIASILIALVTVYQYREQSKEYHKQRLERKENQIRASVNDVLQRRTTFEVTTENLPLIFKEEIYNIADVHNTNFNIYDLEGTLLKTSLASFNTADAPKCLAPEILNGLDASTDLDKRVIMKDQLVGGRFQSSYTYITDGKFKPLGILHIPYLEDDSFSEMELREFLGRLGLIYLVILLIAIMFAYVTSKYITRSLQSVREKLDETRLNSRNEKIHLETPSTEIGSLINAYNSMVDELDESAAKLAKSEREQAWREMAKQVAHEIKNPLTPMRLTVQSFQRKFDPQDPDAQKKMAEFSDTLIQQIDTMSNIASAFSNFAKMPAQQNERLNVVQVTHLALEIFSEDYIHFHCETDEITAVMDRTQLIRVITNIVMNAVQALKGRPDPRIDVTVERANGVVNIVIADNGIGIAEENKGKIFEPKFTTKSSGMGLGLGMVKNIVETYGGNITFTSEEGVGTEFIVSFPKK